MLELRFFWQSLKDSFTALSVLDVALVAVGIYYLLRLVRGTRAAELLKGLAVLGMLVLVTRWAGLATLHWLVVQALLPGVIALIILFQPELRLALEQLGRGKVLRAPVANLQHGEIAELTGELERAAHYLSRERIGALIVLERSVGLEDIIKTGRRIGGIISADLLRTIFYPGTPLHDLAVLIRGNEVAAAGCLLPLTDRPGDLVALGTRHRAALGVTETSDAIVIVISEETGTISLASGGQLSRALSPDVLRERLLELLAPTASPRPLAWPWRRKVGQKA